MMMKGNATASPKHSGAVLLSIVLAASAGTAFVVLDSAFEEPYAFVKTRDIYVQVVCSTALAVVWLEVFAFGVWSVATRRLFSLGILVAIMSLGAVGAIGVCQGQYLRDIAGARVPNGALQGNAPPAVHAKRSRLVSLQASASHALCCAPATTDLPEEP